MTIYRILRERARTDDEVAALKELGRAAMKERSEFVPLKGKTFDDALGSVEDYLTTLNESGVKHAAEAK